MQSSTSAWSLLTFGATCVITGILSDHDRWRPCLNYGGVALILVGVLIFLLPSLQRLFGSYVEADRRYDVSGRAGDSGAVAIAGSGGTVNQSYIRQATFVSPAKIHEGMAPDITLESCVASLLGTSNWYSQVPGQVDRLLDLLGKLSQEAALSHLTIWGRRDLGSGLSLVGLKNNLEPTTPEYWSNHKIDEIQFLKDRKGRSRGALYETSDAFIDLHPSSRQVEKIRVHLGKRAQ